jgi:type I restriction enzyme S subunit
MLKTYQKYKSTDVVWVKEIPEEWNFRKLKFVFQYVVDNRGKTPPISESGIPLLEIKHISGKKVPSYNTDKFVSEDVYKSWFRGHIKKNDILIGTVGSTGETCIYDESQRACIAQNIVGLRAGSDNPMYLYFILSSYHFQKYISASNKNVIQPTLKVSDFIQNKVYLPNSSTQTKIALYLDYKTSLIDNLIKNNEKLIKLFEEQKSVITNNAVTKGLNNGADMKNSGIEWLGMVPEKWRILKLKFIGKSIIGITYSPDNVVDEGNGTLVLRSSNIQKGVLSLKDNVYINKKIPETLKTKTGDILICSRNGSSSLIGKNIVITGEIIGSTFGAFMTVFRSEYWKFLSKFFNSQVFKSQSGLFSSSTINQLTINTLNNLFIALPPTLEEQEEIATHLDKELKPIENLIQKTKKQNYFLTEYRKTLISNIVTGKIDVRDEKIPESGIKYNYV